MFYLLVEKDSVVPADVEDSILLAVGEDSIVPAGVEDSILPAGGIGHYCTC